MSQPEAAYNHEDQSILINDAQMPYRSLGHSRLFAATRNDMKMKSDYEQARWTRGVHSSSLPFGVESTTSWKHRSNVAKRIDDTHVVIKDAILRL